MLQHIKKQLSFFFLFLFLFPTVEKQLHAFEHSADLHCTATDKHFHSEEHTCSICDFTVTDSNVAPETAVQFIVSVRRYLFPSFIKSIHTPAAFSDLPSRAPPVTA